VLEKVFPVDGDECERGKELKTRRMCTHPLHATLDDGVLDADELCEFSLEDHGVDDEARSVGYIEEEKEEHRKRAVFI
jgi:hypothetical protein